MPLAIQSHQPPHGGGVVVVATGQQGTEAPWQGVQGTGGRPA